MTIREVIAQLSALDTPDAELLWKGKPITDILVVEPGELHIVTEAPPDNDPPEK